MRIFGCGGVALCSTALLVGTVGAAEVSRPASDWVVPAPAVDGLNGKAELFGGTQARRTFYGGVGSISAPLEQRFGFQLDGLAGSYRRDFVGAVGAHLFWRDPAQGLIGLYASYAYLDRFGGARVGHVGLEGALYMPRVTLEGVIGMQSGNRVSGVVGNEIETIDLKTRFFDRIDLSYYATDNLKLSIGHRYIGGRHQLALGGEWGIPVRSHMAALFVEGRIGERDYNSVWGGVRFYVGQRPKSLIKRHREDDPVNGLKDEVTAFGNGGSTAPAQTKSQAQLDCEASGDEWIEGIGCVSGPPT